jgi:hypothetical protein
MAWRMATLIFRVAAFGRRKNLPGLTVIASTNCSFQEDVPMRIEAFALWTSLSTVFCNINAMCWNWWNCCPRVWVRQKQKTNGVNHNFQNAFFVILHSLHQWSYQDKSTFKADSTMNIALHPAVNCISFLVVKCSVTWSQWPRGPRHFRLRSLEPWNHGFESHLRHGCFVSFYFCVSVGSVLASGVLQTV